MSGPPSRLPRILFWIAFALALLILAPIGFATVMLDSRPGGGGADWGAKLLVALIVAAVSLLFAWAVAALARLVLRLAGRGG